MKKHCPIPTSHSRLNEAHNALLVAIENYQDPVGFKTQINNTIQALRNITFVLQNEGKNIPQFDVWYEKWRERMRQDEKMKWLNDARVKIVHQEDLAKISTATVSVLTYEKKKVLELSFKPTSTIEEIAVGILKFQLVRLPDHVKKHALLVFERRWIVQDWPEEDLLNILFHCFDVLYGVVEDAHRCCELEIEDCEDYLFDQLSKSDLLQKLRDESERQRIRYVRAFDHRGRVLEREEQSPKERERVRQLAEERYGKEASSEDGVIDSELPFPFNQASFFLQRGKKILQVDKHHVNIVFLYREGRAEPIIQSFVTELPSDKFMMMEKVAANVQTYNASAVAMIGEIWYAPLKDIKHDDGHTTRPEESRKRKEALSLIILMKDRARTHILPFKRTLFGKIKFEEVQSMNTPKKSLVFFAPVFNFWKSQS